MTKPYTLHRGDCIAVMRGMADNSVDAVVTDPPYELGFMGKSWDASGIAYNVELWREALRVLKPGGHLLAFSGARTQHRMVCAIEDAGFEIRDQIMWVYGSGMPKGEAWTQGKADKGGAESAAMIAAGYDGWARAGLKPAHEPICVARKPIIGTVAANVLEYGTGAINIAACRVGTEDTRSASYKMTSKGIDGGGFASGKMHTDGRDGSIIAGSECGRWPANLIHDGSAEVVSLFPAQAGASAPVRGTEASAASVGRVTGERERVAGVFHGDTGSAARFFYCAKASKSDRDSGLDGFAEKPTAFGNQAQAELRRGNLNHSAGNSGMNKVKMRANTHPTVKPTDLMAYLCRLVTPPGGVVLDPFMGSGSTGKAAMREGFQFVGIDLSEEYFPIAQARIEHELAAVTEANKPPPPAPQMDMFAAI